MAESPLNPVTKHREFFGVYGAIAISTCLPLLTLFFGFVSNNEYSIQGIKVDLNAIATQVPHSRQDLVELFFDRDSWLVYLGWFTALAILDVFLPGKSKEGLPLRDNTKLPYTFNGLQMTGLFFVFFAARLLQSTNYYLPELQFIYEHQLQLTAVTTVFAFFLATFVYICSFIPLRGVNGVHLKDRILSVNGNSGNVLFDWFIGRELNPRIGTWDIKLFCELRPGLLLLILINLSCLHEQYHRLGRVSDSVALITALQAFYVFDGVLNEEGVLSMIDITTDGFGFMLAFGDLAWLPWLYSLQTRYLSLPENYLDLGLFNISLIVLLNITGYYIFYLSNRQKSDFKSGKLKHLGLKSIKTHTGSELLCDGWWKVSQHMNYLGDWLIGWSWVLPTGFQTPLTYFYVIYFGVLLIHRQMRDDQKCRDKYGEVWTKYTSEVPYKIVPYVY